MSSPRIWRTAHPFGQSSHRRGQRSPGIGLCTSGRRHVESPRRTAQLRRL